MAAPENRRESVRRSLGLNRDVAQVMDRVAAIISWPYMDHTVRSLKTDLTSFNYLNDIIQKTGNDDRVIYVLFALTLWHIRYGDKDQRAFYITKVRHLYIPLAERLNSELISEDLSTGIFKVEHPEEFQRIVQETASQLGSDIRREVDQAIRNHPDDIDFAVDLMQERFKPIEREMRRVLRSTLGRVLRDMDSVRIHVGLKSPASVYDKISKYKRDKYSTTSELGDLLRAMIITRDKDKAGLAEASIFMSTRFKEDQQQKEKDEQEKKDETKDEAIGVHFNLIYVDSREVSRKWEIQVMDQDDYLKYRFGIEPGRTLAAPIVSRAHWAYKTDRVLRHDKIKPRQNLPGDEMELGLDFAENLSRVYERVNQRMHILILHPARRGDRKSLSVITLDHGGTPFDAGMHRKIQLDEQYRGFTKGGQLLDHYATLQPGMVLEQYTKGDPIRVQDSISLLERLRKTPSLRGRLMLERLIIKPEEYNDAIIDGRDILNQKIKELQLNPYSEDTFQLISQFNEERRLARNEEGNFHFNELAAALAMDLVQPDQLRDFLAERIAMRDSRGPTGRTDRDPARSNRRLTDREFRFLLDILKVFRPVIIQQMSMPYNRDLLNKKEQVAARLAEHGFTGAADILRSENTLLIRVPKTLLKFIRLWTSKLSDPLEIYGLNDMFIDEGKTKNVIMVFPHPSGINDESIIAHEAFALSMQTRKHGRAIDIDFDIDGLGLKVEELMQQPVRYPGWTPGHRGLVPQGVIDFIESSRILEDDISDQTGIYPTRTNRLLNRKERLFERSLGAIIERVNYIQAVRLRQHRMAAGLSVEELANMAGIEEELIIAAEAGLFWPLPEEMRRWHDLMDKASGEKFRQAREDAGISRIAVGPEGTIKNLELNWSTPWHSNVSWQRVAELNERLRSLRRQKQQEQEIAAEMLSPRQVAEYRAAAGLARGSIGNRNLVRNFEMGRNVPPAKTIEITERLWESIAKRLKSARVSADISLFQMATDLDIDDNHLHRIEGGQTKPSLEQIKFVLSYIEKRRRDNLMQGIRKSGLPVSAIERETKVTHLYAFLHGTSNVSDGLLKRVYGFLDPLTSSRILPVFLPVLLTVSLVSLSAFAGQPTEHAAAVQQGRVHWTKIMLLSAEVVVLIGFVIALTKLFHPKQRNTQVNNSGPAGFVAFVNAAVIVLVIWIIKEIINVMSWLGAAILHRIDGQDILFLGFIFVFALLDHSGFSLSAVWKQHKGKMTLAAIIATAFLYALHAYGAQSPDPVLMPVLWALAISGSRAPPATDRLQRPLAADMIFWGVLAIVFLPFISAVFAPEWAGQAAGILAPGSSWAVYIVIALAGFFSILAIPDYLRSKRYHVTMQESAQLIGIPQIIPKWSKLWIMQKAAVFVVLASLFDLIGSIFNPLNDLNNPPLSLSAVIFFVTWLAMYYFNDFSPETTQSKLSEKRRFKSSTFADSAERAPLKSMLASPQFTRIAYVGLLYFAAQGNFLAVPLFFLFIAGMAKLYSGESKEYLSLLFNQHADQLNELLKNKYPGSPIVVRAAHVSIFGDIVIWNKAPYLLRWIGPWLPLPVYKGWRLEQGRLWNWASDPLKVAIEQQPRTLHRPFADLNGEEYDLVIVGGGIVGSSTANQITQTGERVLLLDKDDWASGTSSKTTKILHGGIRYLENWDFSLVREALRERVVQRRAAPHLTRTVRFILPMYEDQGRPLWKLMLGVWLYDVLSGRYTVGQGGFLPRSQVLQLMPGIKQEGLVGAATYYDVQMDDARLTLENVLKAVEHGAAAVSHA
jgi:predicted transcriptional regulator